MNWKEFFKLTKGKIIVTLLFGLFWFLFLKASEPVCDICPGPKPTNCIYDKFILFQSCNCGCYSLVDVINNYA